MLDQLHQPVALLDPLLDELVETLGLTRLRFAPPRREWEDALNDDTAPFHATQGSFRKTATDLRAAKIFLPFKRRVEARGEHFEFYVSPSFFAGGSSGSAETSWSYIQNTQSDAEMWRWEMSGHEASELTWVLREEPTPCIAFRGPKTLAKTLQQGFRKRDESVRQPRVVVRPRTP